MNRALAQRIAISAAVALACVGIFFACFEKREVSVFDPVSAEVRRNPYLALARVLERMGHDVSLHDDVSAIDSLPTPPATVFLPRSRATLGEVRTQRLLDWVERGGHLVVVTYTVWEDVPDAKPGEASERLKSGRPDLLLDRFGLRQRVAPAEELAQDVAAAVTAQNDEDGAGGEDGSEADDEAPKLEPPTAEDIFKGEWMPWTRESALASLGEDDEPLELEFHSGYWWDDTQQRVRWSVDGKRGPHLVEVDHGAGVISALTSDDPLLNDSIGDAQHAEFLVRWLRHGRDGRVPIAIFHSAVWPSLWTLIERAWLPAIVAAGLLLAAWLWRSLVRFGPVLPEPALARRRWLEHLEAAGWFQWRQDRGAALLADLRADLARELSRRRPGLARLPEAERFERLAQAASLSREEVAHAFTETATNARPFTAAVRALERIRAAL